MMMLAIYVLVAGALALSLARDRARTRAALRVAIRSLERLAPSLLGVVGLVGLLLALVPNEAISRHLGAGAGLSGTLAASLLGSLLLIPSLVAFPLAASLLRSGATVATVAAFVTTLTMVGIVTLPVEMRELGRRFAVLRNVLSFLCALLIALAMEAIL